MSTTQPIRNREKLQKFKSYYQQVKPNNRNYTLIILALNSALRISDILHLTYEDIYDFKEKRLKTHLIVEEKKTGKRNQIYINTAIRKALTVHIGKTPANPADWLFPSQRCKNQPLSRYQAYRIVREAAAHVGLGANISCHSLRKTFGYYAWKQGASPILLMNIYNHSTFQVTKRYLGIEQDEKDSVFEKIRL